MTATTETTPKPSINVTPLIDVLLVMLIIFMVAAPLKPSRFAAKLPSEPDHQKAAPNPKTLVVTIDPDRTLKLNGLSDMGTMDDTSKLSMKLVSLFQERTKNRVYRDELLARLDLPEELRHRKNGIHQGAARNSLWRSCPRDGRLKGCWCRAYWTTTG